MGERIDAFLVASGIRCKMHDAKMQRCKDAKMQRCKI
jgi:hypothetical protein